MAKSGRANAYDVKIKPNLKKIKSWAAKGVTERSMSEQLGIAYSTFNKYKAEVPEFAEALKNGRQKAVTEIENALYKRAVGYPYTETKTTETENGGIKRETVTKMLHPDVTACIYLLKHWGKDRGYTNDPMTIELKKKELELKEKMAEENNW